MTDPSQLEEFLEEQAIRRVRRVWALSRDHGDWDGMRSCFHPDATILVSWYGGPVAQFLERTIAMAAERRPEERSKHWYGNWRIVARQGSRAILESDIMVTGRDRIDGHLFDFTTYGRFFDRFEKRDGQWKILQMTCIYDKDRLDPVVPGSVPAEYFGQVAVSGPDSGFAFMRFRQGKRGRTVPQGIVLGDSEGEKRLRSEAMAWVRGA